jgi:hypothetical protein
MPTSRKEHETNFNPSCLYRFQFVSRQRIIKWLRSLERGMLKCIGTESARCGALFGMKHANFHVQVVVYNIWSDLESWLCGPLVVIRCDFALDKGANPCGRACE